jgi:hypothetical protein
MPSVCKCGAPLGRSGKCPALCEPVPQPAPKYDGPAVVGRSHTARLAAPVYAARPYRRGERIRFVLPGGMIVDGNVTEAGGTKLKASDDHGNVHTVKRRDVLEVLSEGHKFGASQRLAMTPEYRAALIEGQRRRREREAIEVRA